jgi:hypothetical protein
LAAGNGIKVLEAALRQLLLYFPVQVQVERFHYNEKYFFLPLDMILCPESGVTLAGQKKSID